MSAPAIWMLLTAPAADGIAIALTAEIGEGTHGIGLRRVDMPGASADLTASAETGAAGAAQILYREQFLRRHLVVRYRAERELFNVHGRSADLAFALALAASVKATQEGEDGPPRILAATGTLDDTGRVQKVDGIAAKLALALAHLPPQSVFVFPEALRGRSSRRRAVPRGCRGDRARPHVAHLEDAMRLLGLAVFRRNEDEFRQWQELSREAEQWSRGERVLIPAGPQLRAADALYARRAADWSAGDVQILSYIRASLGQRDRRRVLASLAVGVPALAASGFAVRSTYDYVASLHRTRIPFDNVSVPGPDYQIAAGPYLRRFGVAIDARMPDSSAVLIASNIGLYRGEAVDAMTAQEFPHPDELPAHRTAWLYAGVRPAGEIRAPAARAALGCDQKRRHPSRLARHGVGRSGQCAGGGR